MDNPYYNLFKKLWGTEYPDRFVSIFDAFSKRHIYNTRYSYAVPNAVTLLKIKDFSNKICEIGAGTGYWLWMFKQLSMNIVGYDDFSTHYKDWQYSRWFRLHAGGSLSIKDHPDKTLFLCWPPMSSMAHEALKAYRGNKIVYIGEGESGCTADDDFHNLLNEEWDVEQYNIIPQWPGIHDNLHLCRRK